MKVFEKHHRIKSLQFLVFSFILILNAHCSFSQKAVSIQNNPYAKFQTLKTDDGLTNNHVLDIVQDHHNYIWVATINGLNRYDGRKFRTYQHDPENIYSLPQGVVTCLEEDADGILWVGTENGLCVFNSEDEQFLKIWLDLPTDNPNYIRAIFNESDRIIWVEVSSGFLVKYDKTEQKVIEFWKHSEVWQPYYYYHDIYRDKRGILWIGGRGHFPTYLDENTNELVYIETGSLAGRKKENDISCYFEDNMGNFWISGLDGAYKYNPETNYFSKFLNPSTFSIIQDQNGNVWFATKNGIYRYISESQKMLHYKSDINNPYSLPDNHVNKVFEDAQGTIWIGTDGGLAFYRTNNDYINFLNHIPGNQETLSSNIVTASLVDSKGNIWIGYQNHGIDFYETKTGQIKHYRAGSLKGALPSDNIRCFFEDSKGDLYIGLWEGVGFARKKKNTEMFELFTYNKESTYQDWYYDFTEDSIGNFYIGFWGANGLQLFEREKNKFGKNLKYKFESPYESRLITKLITDSKNQIWMGTTDAGLYIYYPETDTSRRFFDQAKLNTSFDNLSIFDIIEDRKGNIWIAADSLFYFDTRFEKFKVFADGKGLVSSKVYKILEDESGNLWLGTYEGVICFNPEWNYCLSFPDLADIEMTHEFRTGSKLKDGRLLFGGKKGLIIFDPKVVLDKNALPDIFLTELAVKGVLKVPDISDIQQIQLEYDENFFSVGFSTTDLTAGPNYSFRYRLYGLENNWVYVEKTSNIARYTNVPYGKYILEIQLAMNNSNWKNIKMKSIVIDIHPPIWKRSWFIIVFLLLILLIITIIIRDFYKRLNTQKKLAELKEHLLRAQINPHFIFNALVAIQGFIYKKEEKEAGKYLSEFSKLIRLILENTKEEYITLEKELQLLEYYLRLQKLRFSTKFDYKIEIDPTIDLEDICIPPMLAQPYIENAIEHGVTKMKGIGHILISMKLEDKHIVYIIKDNGIGRIKSLELKRGMETHKSYGTEITEERLSFIRKNYNFKIKYSIEDLYDDQQPIGTLVTFKIPLNLK